MQNIILIYTNDHSITDFELLKTFIMPPHCICIKHLYMK